MRDGGSAAAPSPAEPPSPDLDPEESLDLLFRDLGSARAGLAPREAARRLEQHGPNSIHRRELWGVAFELAFAAAVVYAPPLQAVFHTRGPGLPELLLLATFPVIVWGSDELRRAWLRRRVPAEAPESQPSAG